MMTLVVIK